jgi:Uma2 family endonuclease
MQTQPKRYITPEEYLMIERIAPYKSEYYDGEIFALAGANDNHNAISVNIVVTLHLALKGKRCFVYTNDMRLRVSSKKYTYPDVMVVCGKKQFLDEKHDTLLNPILIAEVLSHSTETYDRGDKFASYRTIPTFQEYLLVAQDRPHVEKFNKNAEGLWVLSEASGMEGMIELTSIRCTLPLSDIYAEVEFPEVE